MRTPGTCERELLEFLETSLAGAGRGHLGGAWPARHFTHSKVMAWLAFDRAIKEVENFGLEGPLDAGAQLRDASTTRSAARASTPSSAPFVQSYGSKELDASLLMIPLVGFLPPTDPRVRGTVEAIERDLMAMASCARYHSERTSTACRRAKALPGVQLLAGRQLGAAWAATTRPRALFERLLELRTTSGCCPRNTTRGGRLLGNFPQAFSHVGLVNTAHNLADTRPRPPASVSHLRRLIRASIVES